MMEFARKNNMQERVKRFAAEVTKLRQERQHEAAKRQRASAAAKDRETKGRARKRSAL